MRALYLPQQHRQPGADLPVVLAVADPAALVAEDQEAEAVRAVSAADARAEEAQAEDECMVSF